MLNLTNILLESQNRVSSAVEKSLRQVGVVVEPPAESADTSPRGIARAPSDPNILKAAALNRIEDLLTALVNKLNASPASSPHSSPQTTPRARSPVDTPTPSLPPKDELPRMEQSRRSMPVGDNHLV